jgi:hypothetical protein
MRMTIGLSVLAGAVALTLAGAAQADMSGMVGNTIVLSGDNNMQIKVQLHADGTYQTTIAGGPTMKGTWKDKDGQLCYTQTDPAPQAGQSDFCAQGMNGHKVGDTWTQAGPGGNGSLKGSVVAGQ